MGLRRDEREENSPLLQMPTFSSEVTGEDERNSSGQNKAIVKTKASGAMLLIYSVFLLLSAVGNSIFFKKMTNKFPNYPYFLSQITTVVYVPVFWSIVVWTRIFTRKITPQMMKFPKYKFFVMGALDALAGIFMLFGGVHTSGSTQALLLQAVIPITMFLSYILLKERYKSLQYLGAFVIVVGLGFVLVPQSLAKDSSGDNQLLFNLIFLASDIPQAFSSVYKEIAFTEEMDVNYLQAWVAVWQVVFGLILCPINSLKFLGDNYMPISQIPNALVNGFKCMAGINSIVNDCWTEISIPGIPQCDSCQNAWIPLLVYMTFNVLYNIAIVLVIKNAGANLLYFVMTLRLPLVQLAFSLSFINSPPDTFKWYAIVGLIFILTGLVVYRFASKPQKSVTDISGVAEEEAMRDVIMPFGAGFAVDPPLKLVYVRKYMERRQNPQRIRSGFYARLGITSSPKTAHFRDSFV